MDIQSFLIGLQAGQKAGSGDSGGSSGGGTLPAGLYVEALDILPARAGAYGQAWYEWNGTLYAFVNQTTGNSGINLVYKWTDSAWTQVHEASSNTNITGGTNTRFIEFNGKLHIFGNETTYHAVFDGSTLTRCVNMPLGFSHLFKNNGTIMGMYYNGRTYSWDESSDTWTELGTTSGVNSLMKVYEVNGIVYGVKSTALYTYNDLTMTQVATGSFDTDWRVVGNCVYVITKSNSYLYTLSEFDLSTYQTITIGRLPNMYYARLLEYNGELTLLHNCGAYTGQEAWLGRLHIMQSE